MRGFVHIIAFAAALAVPGYACAQEPAGGVPAAARTAPAVTVARVQREEIAEEVHVSGTLVPREEVLVAPEVEGFAVTEILVEEGDSVEKGQVLARLSRSSLDAETAQAQASIAQARAQIAEAEATVAETAQALERSSALRRSGTSSAQQYEQALSAARVAEARLNAARESVKVAEAQRQLIAVRLARTEIKAPAAGIVSRRTLRVGAIASMAAEPAFRIIEDGDVELAAQVVDATLARLAKEQVVRVMPAGTTKPLMGRIRLLPVSIDQTTRLGEVRVALDRSEDARVGAFASGVVEIGRHMALTLPISAVTFSARAISVDAIKENRVVNTEVTTGLRAPMRIEITSGLVEGDMVVARAGSFLRGGDMITPVEAAATEAAQR